MFVLRAARRHVWLCLGVGVSIAVLGTAAVAALPRTYGATSKVYLQPASALTSALTGGRRLGDANDKPKPINTEVVVNRDNLMSLVHEADLLKRWKLARTWPLRLKDRVMEALIGPPSLADQERALAQVLGASIFVNNEDQGSIRFTVNWREPEGAFLLTSLVQRNFFKDWQTDELSAISRAADLLQEELQPTNDSIAPSIQAVQDSVLKVRARTAAQAAPASDAAAAKKPVAAVGPVAIPTPASAQRSSAEDVQRLEDNRRAQRAVADPWQHRIAELRFQLAELKGTYGPEHPLVRQQEAKVDAISREPEELVQLRAQESELVAALTRTEQSHGDAQRPRSLAAAAAAAGSGSSVMQYASLRSMVEREQDDPEVSAARIHLEAVLSKSRELQGRLDAARMELATTQLSFKHRFKVVEPAELPRKVLKPNPIKLFGIVAALSLVLGLFAGAARELVRGRVLESWQIRRLGVPVLAEVELRNLRLPPS